MSKSPQPILLLKKGSASRYDIARMRKGGIMVTELTNAIYVREWTQEPEPSLSIADQQALKIINDMVHKGHVWDIKDIRNWIARAALSGTVAIPL